MLFSSSIPRLIVSHSFLLEMNVCTVHREFQIHIHKIHKNNFAPITYSCSLSHHIQKRIVFNEWTFLLRSAEFKCFRTPHILWWKRVFRQHNRNSIIDICDYKKEMATCEFIVCSKWIKGPLKGAIIYVWPQRVFKLVIVFFVVITCAKDKGQFSPFFSFSLRWKIRFFCCHSSCFADKIFHWMKRKRSNQIAINTEGSNPSQN